MTHTHRNSVDYRVILKIFQNSHTFPLRRSFATRIDAVWSPQRHVTFTSRFCHFHLSMTQCSNVTGVTTCWPIEACLLISGCILIGTDGYFGSELCLFVSMRPNDEWQLSLHRRAEERNDKSSHLSTGLNHRWLGTCRVCQHLQQGKNHFKSNYAVHVYRPRPSSKRHNYGLFAIHQRSESELVHLAKTMDADGHWTIFTFGCFVVCSCIAYISARTLDNTKV